MTSKPEALSSLSIARFGDAFEPQRHCTQKKGPRNRAGPTSDSNLNFRLTQATAAADFSFSLSFSLCIRAGRFARRSVFALGICSPAGLTIASINAFWAST